MRQKTKDPLPLWQPRSLGNLSNTGLSSFVLCLLSDATARWESLHVVSIWKGAFASRPESPGASQQLGSYHTCSTATQNML